MTERDRAAKTYRRGAIWARLWGGVFQAQTVVLALVAGAVIGSWLERVVAGVTLSTPLEGLAVPASLMGALAVGLALFLVLRTVPRQLLVLRVKGVVSARAACETLALGGGWLLGLTFCLIDPGVLKTYLGIATATTIGYVLPRLWLMRRGSNSDPCLWVVLPHAHTVHDWPKLVDQIARSHRVGPLTLVSPPDAVPLGEHLHLADRLGILDCLFPRLEIEIRDWQRALPPADRRWSGVVHRQVHPPVALMPLLLDSYLGRLDQVLLIASCEDDVELWRGRLPVDRTRVLWVPAQAEEQVKGGAEPGRVAGYTVIVMDAAARRHISVPRLFSSRLDPGKVVFVSYSRPDSADGNRLGAGLSARLPQALISVINIFELNERALRACGLLLVVISPRWLTETEAFSHLEIMAALKRTSLRVIPVLVGGARMPAVDELPDDLKPLARHNALELTEKRWDYDVGILADTLAGMLGLPSPRPAPARQDQTHVNMIGSVLREPPGDASPVAEEATGERSGEPHDLERERPNAP